MGWTIETFNGSKGNGQPSMWLVAMFELCRAVRERALCGFMNSPYFYKADGTTTQSPTMADLTMLYTGRAPDEDESYVKLNMDLIQGAVINTLISVPTFTESSGTNNLWTLAGLEAAVGANLTQAARGPNDARWWQAMQDALDRLIYGKITRGISYTAFGHVAQIEERGGIGSTAADAWSDMLSDPPTTYESVGSARCYARMSIGGFGHGAEGTYKIALPAARVSGIGLAGHVSKVSYIVGLIRKDDDMFTGTLSISCGSASGSFSSFSGDVVGNLVYGQAVMDGDPGDIALGVTGSLGVYGSLPGTAPFTMYLPPGMAAYSSTFSAEAKSAVIYIDLASQLTDQT